MYGWLNLYLNQGIKMFIFSLTYLKPISEVEKQLPQHIDYLERYYQSSNDFKYLASLLKYAPNETQAFIHFDQQTIKRTDGVIPTKTRELIALAIALTMQCAYCIDVHVKGAKRAGVSVDELAELISISASVRAGATMAHGLLAMRLFEQNNS